MPIHNDETYSTPDLHLGAYLQAKGMTVLRLDRSGKRILFVFANDKAQCEYLEKSFWNGNGTVSAKAFSNSLRTLKDWLFSEARKSSQ